MPCFYCGKRVSLVRQMADPDFCNDEHRKRYHDLARSALRRLTDASEPAKPEARTPRTAPARPPAAKRPQQPSGPLMCAPLPAGGPLPAAGAATAARETITPFPPPGLDVCPMPRHARATALAPPVYGFLTVEGSLRRRFTRPRSVAAPRLTAGAVTAMDRSWLVRARGVSPARPVPAFPAPLGARTAPVPAFAAARPAFLSLPELRDAPARTASSGCVCGFVPALLQPCFGPPKPAYAECVFAAPAPASLSRGDGGKTWHPAVSCPPAPLRAARPVPGPDPAPRACHAFAPAEDLRFLGPAPAPPAIHAPPKGNFAPSVALRPAPALAERAGAAAAPRFEIGPALPAHGGLRRRGGTLEASARAAGPAPAIRKAAEALRPAAAEFAARGVQIGWRYRTRPAEPLGAAGFQPIQEPRGTVPAVPVLGQAASAAFSPPARLPGSAAPGVRRNPRTAGFEPVGAGAARVLALRAIQTATWPSATPLLPARPGTEQPMPLRSQAAKPLLQRRVDRAATAAAGASHVPALPAFRVPVHHAASEPCQGVPPRDFAATPPRRPRIVPAQVLSEAREIASQPLPPLTIPVLAGAPAAAGRIPAAWSETWQPTPERRPAAPAEAFGSRGFTVALGLPQLRKRMLVITLDWAGPVTLAVNAPLKRSAPAHAASATFSIPAPEAGALPAAFFQRKLGRPELHPFATLPARLRSTPAADTYPMPAPGAALPLLPGTEREHAPAATALRKVRVAASKRTAAREPSPFATAVPAAHVPAFAPLLEAHGEPAPLAWRAIAVKTHTIPASFRTNAGVKLQPQALAVPGLVRAGSIGRRLPVSTFEPLAGAGAVLKRPVERGAALACSFTVAPLAAVRPLRVRATSGVGGGVPVPLPAQAVNVALSARTASAAMPPGEPATPRLPHAPHPAGLPAAGFTPIAARPGFRIREASSETWQAWTSDARLDSASTPSVPAAHAPARGLLRTVRVRLVARARTLAAPLHAQLLPAPEALLPLTPVGAARMAAAAPVRETVPPRVEDARARTVAHAGVESQPGEVAVVRRVPALPLPGYPAFAFTGFEVADYDDDSTYAAAKPSEAAPLAAVLPRGRDLRPVLVRLPMVCGWLNGHHPWPAGAAPVPVPHNGITLAIKPVIAAREAVPDQEDRVRLAAAVGEGWESARMWKGASRLFR